MDGAAEKQQVKYHSECQKAFKLRQLAPHSFLITSCEETKEAWDALKKYFEREILAIKLIKKSILDKMK